MTVSSAGRLIGSPELELHGLAKAYGQKVVFEGVDLTVGHSEALAIIGPSGSGKSTLCRVAAGLEPFQRGKVVVAGEVFEYADSRGQVRRGPHFTALRRQVGTVFQHYTLFRHMTVMQNVMLGPHRVLRCSRMEARERAEGALERVAMSGAAADYPARLSGGQQQRVAIARELAMDRRIIFFDEVTSALDPELVGEVLSVMQRLASEGMTMVVVTHEMGFARHVATQLAVMVDGHIIETGRAESVFASPAQERTRAFLDRVLDSGLSARGTSRVGGTGAVSSVGGEGRE